MAMKYELLKLRNSASNSDEDLKKIFQYSSVDSLSLVNRGRFISSENGGGRFLRSNEYSIPVGLVNSVSGTYKESADLTRRQIFDNAKARFIELARSEYFEYGYTQSSERYLIQFAKDNQNYIGELIQDIFLSELKDIDIMRALLNAVASLPYEVVRPHGQVLAIAALSHAAAEINEAAIRAYETWGHEEGVGILSNIKCNLDWLDDYRKQVISDLCENI